MDYDACEEEDDRCDAYNGRKQVEKRVTVKTKGVKQEKIPG
jgi:hypothetical protein